MPETQRERVYVRSADGSPTTVSSRADSLASKLCRRHRVGNLTQAATIGLIPAFVNVDVLTRESDRVLRASAFDKDAERRVQRAGPVHDDGVRRGLVAAEAMRLRAAELADAVEPDIAVHARNEIAGRSLQIMTKAPFDVVRFELDADLDVHTELVFDRDVTLATLGDLRIYRGAALVSTSSSFILRAASAQGDLLPVTASTLAGVSFNDWVQRT